MDVLFLRNPDTGEVRRFLAKSAVRHEGETFEGWVTVDWQAWVDANADLPTVGAAIARYRAENGIEAPATQEPAPVSAAGADAERLENYRAIFHDVIEGHLTSTPEVMAEHGLYLLEHVASLEAQLAAAVAAVLERGEQLNKALIERDDYRDQIWVHQGTLRVLKSWLQKADGFGVEDGFTESAILGMVIRDLEASERMDTRTMIADGAEEA